MTEMTVEQRLERLEATVDALCGLYDKQEERLEEIQEEADAHE